VVLWATNVLLQNIIVISSQQDSLFVELLKRPIRGIWVEIAIAD
jgi:hypothetical protein